ncbi:hypothetical protein HK100_008873, partial [Physocladia obscura]
MHLIRTADDGDARIHARLATAMLAVLATSADSGTVDAATIASTEDARSVTATTTTSSVLPVPADWPPGFTWPLPGLPSDFNGTFPVGSPVPYGWPAGYPWPP